MVSNNFTLLLQYHNTTGNSDHRIIIAFIAVIPFKTGAFTGKNCLNIKIILRKLKFVNTTTA